MCENVHKIFLLSSFCFYMYTVYFHLQTKFSVIKGDGVGEYKNDFTRASEKCVMKEIHVFPPLLNYSRLSLRLINTKTKYKCVDRYNTSTVLGLCFDIIIHVH